MKGYGTLFFVGVVAGCLILGTVGGLMCGLSTNDGLEIGVEIALLVGIGIGAVLWLRQMFGR